MSKATRRYLKPISEHEILKRQANKNITQLRIQQKNAIQNLDYDTAENIEQQIKDEKVTAVEFLYRERVKKFEERLHRILSDSKSLIDGLKEKYIKDERQIRVRVNNEFNSLRERQVKDLISLEKDYASARLRETERTIPEHEELLKRSKNAALVKDFELARKYRDSAALVAETDLEARLQKTDSDFENLRRTTISKQREEIEYLSRKLDDELKALSLQAQNRLKKEDNIRNIKIIGHFDNYATLIRGMVEIPDIENRIKDLDNLCNQILREHNCPRPNGIGDASALNSTLPDPNQQKKSQNTTKISQNARNNKSTTSRASKSGSKIRK